MTCTLMMRSHRSRAAPHCNTSGVNTLIVQRIVSLHDIFHAVVVGKLMYASDAWRGFSNANVRQKIFAFIRRCRPIRTGFCSPDLADFYTVYDLYTSSDEKLFKKILTCPDHILRTLLPPPIAQNYNLRNIPHNRQLLESQNVILLLECCTAMCIMF